MMSLVSGSGLSRFRLSHRIIHTGLRHVHAHGKKVTMAAKSLSKKHTCLDCFLVPFFLQARKTG